MPGCLSLTATFADINECTSLSEPCRPGFSCINTVGSYTCQRNQLLCSRGYHANEDGTKCVGEDVCPLPWACPGDSHAQGWEGPVQQVPGPQDVLLQPPIPLQT